jgi:hypothetical protein
MQAIAAAAAVSLPCSRKHAAIYDSVSLDRCLMIELIRSSSNRWRGVTRGRTVRTTTPDPAHAAA